MIYILTLAFIILDFATGLVKAFKAGTFTSTRMRAGLYTKSGLLGLMVLGGLADYAQEFFDLGVTVPTTGAVCGYIVLMEIASIIENLGEINPAILPEKITNLFFVLKNGGGANDER